MNVRVISDTTLRLEWDSAAVKFGNSYKLNLGAILTDAAGNKVPDYVFKAAENMAPKLWFDPTYPLATLNDQSSTTKTNADNDTQVIYMTEREPLFLNRFDGILWDNESPIDVEYGSIITYNAKHSMEGREGYPTPATFSNFQNIPGEYVFTYRVDDPDDSSVTSNTITRTYRVSSPVMITENGQPLQLLTVRFTRDDMLELYEHMLKNNLSINDALNDMINSRYVATGQVQAFHYSHEAVIETLPIVFDTSSVTEDAFKNGYEGALTFTVKDESRIYILSLAGTEPDKEIVVKNPTYEVDNHYSRSEAIKHFGAQVISKSTGAVLHERLLYDFSDVDLKKYDEPQVVTITLYSEEDMNLPGVERIQASASVVIRKVKIYEHPEDIPNYWVDIINYIRDGMQQDTYTYEIDYKMGALTPTTLFAAIKNKEDVQLKLEYPSGVNMIYSSESIQRSLIPDQLNYWNMNVERMYDPYVTRDANGVATHQFATSDQLRLAGSVKVTMPLDPSIDTSQQLRLYHIDDATNNYVLVETLSSSNLSNGTLSLDFKDFRGRYVVTSAQLSGECSAPPAAVIATEK